MKKSIALPLLLSLLCLLTLLFYFTGLRKLLSYEVLKAKHDMLQLFVEAHPLGSPLLFIGGYTLSAFLTVPIAALLCLLAGLLFPQPLCTLYVLAGATLGASCAFLTARTALRDRLYRKASPFLAKMEEGFRKHAVNYLLFLRLVPLFPFWLVNIAPAFFGVTLSTFLWTTTVGTLPSAFIFTQAGKGLRTMFHSSDAFSLASLLNTEMKIALICMGVFALIPIGLKPLLRWIKK